MSGYEQILELENTVKQVKEQKNQWLKKIKEAELKVKGQGKQLVKMEDEDEVQAWLKGYIDELRVWKEKVSRSEELLQKEEKNKENQK